MSWAPARPVSFTPTSIGCGTPFEPSPILRLKNGSEAFPAKSKDGAPSRKKPRFSGNRRGNLVRFTSR